MTDPQTISVYDAKAQDYLDTFTTAKPSRHLSAFIASLPAGAQVLDIGCGPGAAAAAMRDAGLNVTALDPSVQMAAIGKQKFNLDIRIGFSGSETSKTDTWVPSTRPCSVAS